MSKHITHPKNSSVSLTAFDHHFAIKNLCRILFFLFFTVPLCWMINGPPHYAKYHNLVWMYGVCCKKKFTNWRLWSLFYKMVNYDLQRNANNVVFGRVYVLMNRIEIVSERRMVRGLKAKVWLEKKLHQILNFIKAQVKNTIYKTRR